MKSPQRLLCRHILPVIAGVAAAGLLNAQFLGQTPGSRDNASGSRRRGIAPFANVNAVYTQGLGEAATKAPGFGYSAGFGAIGHQQWRRTSLDVLYSARYVDYSTHRTNKPGLDHVFGSSLERQATERLNVGVSVMGGGYRSGVGMPLGGSLGNTTSFMNFTGIYTPEVDITNERSWFGGAGGTFSYALSRRWTAQGAGTAFRTWRAGPGVDALGSVASGQMSYRLNRASSIGVLYGFMHTEFLGGFGVSDAHMVMGQYERSGRRWNFSLAGGAYRLDASRLRRVTLSREIALLFGVTSGTEVANASTYGFAGQASISKSWRQSSASLTGGRTLHPGNGVYLTSQSDRVFAGYSYSGLRGWGLTGGLGYTRLSNRMGQEYKPLNSAYVSASVGRRIVGPLSFSSMGSMHRYALGNTHRESYMLAVGLMFSPGDLPLPLF